MIEFQLNIDISDRLEDAVKALADALVMREKLRHEYAQGWERVSFSQTPDEQREGGTEKDPTPAESEPAKESQSQGVSDEAKVEEAPEPPRPLQPTEGEKPQKKARAKAQKTGPERAGQEVTPEPTEVTPEPTEVTPETTEVTPETTEVTPEPEKAQEAAKNEDPMQGLNLMQAVKTITDELRERGIEMADANARVRRRANELGLSYSSFTCLVKAIGYTEARRVVLDE